MATPGLGSFTARRWLAGAGQLVLAIAGFVMVLVWFFAVMSQYYGQVAGDVAVHPVGWIGETGAILFGAAWLWALVTSVSLWREAVGNNEQLSDGSETRPVPPRIVDLPPKPPEQP